jgi:ribonuclease HI
MQIIPTITYNIWLARNNKIYQGKNTPASEAVTKALKNLNEYCKHHVENRLRNSNIATTGARHDKSWSPPTGIYHKLNVDAHLSDDGRWGYGLILRRADGRCVGAATRVCDGTSDAAMAEARGLLEATRFVEEGQLSNIVTELDAAIIVQALARRDFPITNWGKCVRNCARVIDRLSSVSVTWVNREGNQAAHALARWALREPNQFWVSNFPLCILIHIQKDMRFVP